MLSVRRPSLMIGFLCLTSLIFHLELLAQNNVLNSIDSIFKQKNHVGNIRLIKNSSTKYLSNQDPLINENVLDKITYSNGKIFLNVNGTGRLYLVDSNYQVKRIDSTVHQGATFGAIFTNHNDTIIQIGGYGFWETNGAIRYFNPNYHEWNIHRTNKNIRIALGVNSIFFEDKIHKKIYVIYRETSPEYVKSEKIDFLNVQCLDLNTRQWWEDPKKLNPSIGSNMYELKEFAVCSQGLIIGSKHKKNVILLDFQNNTCFSVKDALIEDIIQATNKSTDYIRFSSDQVYNIYSISDNTIKSFKINSAELHLEREEVYVEPSLFEKFKENLWIILLLISNMILLVAGFIMFKPKKEHKSTGASASNDVAVDLSQKTVTFKIEELFEEIERKILKTVCENQKKLQKNTSIDEINAVIGIEEKPIKIQNNIRAEIILSINKKFNTYLTTNDLIIERIRSDFDKRFFEYRLNRKYIYLVEKL
jgi:hypothetical protein